MKKLILIITLLLSTNALSSTSSHILSGSSNSALSFVPKVNDTGYQTTFNLGLGYTYSFGNSIEIGGTTNLIIGYSNSLSLLVGPGYSFGGEDINNSFFVQHVP